MRLRCISPKVHPLIFEILLCLLQSQAWLLFMFYFVIFFFFFFWSLDRDSSGDHLSIILFLSSRNEKQFALLPFLHLAWAVRFLQFWHCLTLSWYAFVCSLFPYSSVTAHKSAIQFSQAHNQAFIFFPSFQALVSKFFIACNQTCFFSVKLRTSYSANNRQCWFRPNWITFATA